MSDATFALLVPLLLLLQIKRASPVGIGVGAVVVMAVGGVVFMGGGVAAAGGASLVGSFLIF